jgi:riboflavin kinase/FMN adenylyltransferase
MHLGHQMLLKKLASEAKKENKASVVISYTNHPAEVLRPQTPICRICTLEQKTQLIEKLNIDLLVLLTFDKEFAAQSAEEFLTKLQTSIPYSQLILGWDATLGKDREGSKDTVKKLATQYHFKVDYLDQLLTDQKPVSSTEIRKNLAQGHLKEIEHLLGRKYSILSKVFKGEGKGKKLGFPTANLDVRGLCLPPLGVYAVDALIDGKSYKAIANLGVAPTMRQDSTPILEVHVFDFEKDLYDQSIEVIFKSFIRPEKKFTGPDELRAQIAKDIQLAKES